MVNMELLTMKVDQRGRGLLPFSWRKSHQVKPATKLFAAVNEEGGLVIETREQGLRRARAIVRKFIPENISLVDEIIQDHRTEAASEHTK